MRDLAFTLTPSLDMFLEIAPLAVIDILSAPKPPQ